MEVTNLSPKYLPHSALPSHFGKSTSVMELRPFSLNLFIFYLEHNRTPAKRASVQRDPIQFDQSE